MSTENQTIASYEKLYTNVAKKVGEVAVDLDGVRHRRNLDAMLIIAGESSNKKEVFAALTRQRVTEVIEPYVTLEGQEEYLLTVAIRNSLSIVGRDQSLERSQGIYSLSIEEGLREKYPHLNPMIDSLEEDLEHGIATRNNQYADIFYKTVYWTAMEVMGKFSEEEPQRLEGMLQEHAQFEQQLAPGA